VERNCSLDQALFDHKKRKPPPQEKMKGRCPLQKEEGSTLEGPSVAEKIKVTGLSGKKGEDRTDHG